MLDSAPAVRRTLAGALLLLGVLTTSLVLWMRGDSGGQGVRREGSPVAVPTVLREPAQAEPADDPAQQAADPTEPGPAPAVEDTPAVERRREVEPRTRVGSGALVVDAGFAGMLWVGRGGSLPLDAPAAPAAAALAEGFVRRMGRSVSGDWSVGELRPGALRVLVVGEEGQRFARDDLWVLADETLRVEVSVPASAPLDLNVLTPDGKPVPFARIGLLGERPGGALDALGFAASSPLGVTDAAGIAHLRVPIGPWRLVVEGGGPTPEEDAGLAPFVLDGSSLPGDGPRELTIERSAGGEVRGDLLDPDDLGFEGRRIAAASAIGPGPRQAAALALGVPAEALATVRGATVGADRRFRFGGLPADTLLELRALVESDLTRGDAFAPSTLARVGAREVEVVQRAGATVELEVVEVGAPSAIASFTAELAGTWPGTPRTGRDGRLVWDGLRPYAAAESPTFADLPESDDLTLTITAEGFDVRSSPPLRLRTGETSRVGPVALRRLPWLHLRVVDALTDEPLEGAECGLVATLPEVAVGRTASADTSDGSGRARLTVTADNVADLVVRCRGYAPLRLPAPPPTLAEKPFEVPLVPGATLRARVLDAERMPLRAEVFRRRTRVETGDPFAEEYERALTDADGWVTFHDLEAGAVALAARELPRSDFADDVPARAMSWTSVGVTQGGAVEVDLDALRAFPFVVGLLWQGRLLPGAVVRLSRDLDAFRAPHADARTFLTGPAVRADAQGVADLGALHAGLYALRVEHPLVPGFARALLPVGESGAAALDLAADRLRGAVVLAGQPVDEGRVVVWAHGPYYEDGLELAEGDVLRELMPAPIVLGEFELVDGAFDVAVPPGVEVVVTADTGRESGDYFVEVPEGRREPIVVHVETSLDLEITPDLRGRRSREHQLGVVGVNRNHPWGRGLFYAAYDSFELRVRDLPPGRWDLCLVDLTSGEYVRDVGRTIQKDLPGGRANVHLPWR